VATVTSYKAGVLSVSPSSLLLPSYPQRRSTTVSLETFTLNEIFGQVINRVGKTLPYIMPTIKD